MLYPSSFCARDRRTVLCHAVKRDHPVIDDARHLTLGWSDFMGGYNIADSMVKDRLNKE